jgi:hypothetical protein
MVRRWRLIGHFPILYNPPQLNKTVPSNRLKTVPSNPTNTFTGPCHPTEIPIDTLTDP